MTTRKLTVKLIKSVIGATKRQRDTIRALGLRKMAQEVTHEETPQILGMITKVQRWVEVK